jgi:hypothetical protein
VLRGEQYGIPERIHMTKDSSLRWLPAVASVAALVTAGPLAWSSSFGAFLLVWFGGPALLLGAGVCLLVWAISEKRPQRRRAILATLAVTIVLTPAVIIGVWHIPERIHDRAEFLFWYPTHRRLVDRFLPREGIIMTWDAWGLAGMENESYLVSNPSDTISSTSAASKWAERYAVHHCGIAHATRMRQGLFVLRPYTNCFLQ